MKEFKLPKSNCFLVVGAKKKYKNRYCPYSFEYICGAFKTRKAAIEYINTDGKTFFPKTTKWENYFWVILDSNITNTYKNNKGFALDKIISKNKI